MLGIAAGMASGTSFGLVLPWVLLAARNLCIRSGISMKVTAFFSYLSAYTVAFCGRALMAIIRPPGSLDRRGCRVRRTVDRRGRLPEPPNRAGENDPSLCPRIRHLFHDRRDVRRRAGRNGREWSDRLLGRPGPIPGATSRTTVSRDYKEG